MCMGILIIFLIFQLSLPGCAFIPMEETGGVQMEQAPVADLVSFEKAKELFATYQVDFEKLYEEFSKEFSYINVDVDEDGELTYYYARIDNPMNPLTADEDTILECIENSDLISSLFESLDLNRISYTQAIDEETPAIISIVLSSEVQNNNPLSNHSQIDECGIANSKQPFGDYNYLCGDWFYYQNVM